MQRWIVVFVLFLLTSRAATAQDALVSEIDRWKEFVASNEATDEDWKSIRGVAEPVVLKAEKAALAGRKYYALHLLALVRPMLAARQYSQGRPAEMHEQLSALETEWKRVGSLLAPIMTGAALPSFTASPAIIRAMGEASLSEIKPYYEASLEYGRSTVPDAGLFYLGSAQAQLEMAKFCSTFAGTVTGKKDVPIANLSNEMDAFEDELLAQYKPPASIDSHPIFIRTNALLKGARELYSAGYYHGSLYRLLDARLRLTKLTLAGHSINAQEAAQRAEDVRAKLNQDPADHSIAELFIEMALTEAADTSEGSKGGETANAIFADVLPRYFAAVAPAKVISPRPEPVVRVTLLRWPYT